jgi:hypothetical protein
MSRKSVPPAQARPPQPDRFAAADDKQGASPVGLVKAVFSRHVKLRHDGEGFKLVLEASDGARTPPAADKAANDQAQATVMRHELRALLDGVPHSRKVLTHLAVIEHNLKRKGTLFIYELPLHVLRQALRQLDGLIAPPVPEGLEGLRCRLRDAMGLRERLEREERLRQPVSSFLADHKLQVSEARPSDFDRAAHGFAQSGLPDVTPGSA